MIPDAIEPCGNGRVLVNTSSTDDRIMSVAELLASDDYGQEIITTLIPQHPTLIVDYLPQLDSEAVIITSDDFDLDVAWAITSTPEGFEVESAEGIILSGGRILSTTTLFHDKVATYLATLD